MLLDAKDRPQCCSTRFSQYLGLFPHSTLFFSSEPLSFSVFFFHPFCIFSQDFFLWKAIVGNNISPKKGADISHLLCSRAFPFFISCNPQSILSRYVDYPHIYRYRNNWRRGPEARTQQSGGSALILPSFIGCTLPRSCGVGGCDCCYCCWRLPPAFI